MPKFKVSIFIMVIIASVLAFGLIVCLTTQTYKAVLIKPDRTSLTALLPFKSIDTAETGVYVYAIKVKDTPFLSGNFQIIPDDCLNGITVNGKRIELGVNQENICDTKNGVDINIKKYLHNGTNDIRVEVLNSGGHFGLQFIDTTFYPGFQILIPLASILLLFTQNRYRKYLGDTLRSFFKKNRFALWKLAPVFFVLIFFIISIFIKESSIHRWLFIWAAVLSVTVPCTCSIYRNCLAPKFSVSLFIFCIAICAAFICCHLYDEYAYDVEGHVQYIQYIIDTGHSPNASGGWMFYHPSFYYRAAALFWKGANLNGALNYEEFLKIIQGFTLTLFIVYCYFSIRTIDLIFRERGKDVKASPLYYKAYVSAVTLFLLWPVNSIFSGRIGNDIMFEFFYAITFYMLVKWWRSQKMSDFFIILILVSLAIWSKSNGFILLGMTGILMILRYCSNREKQQYKYRYIKKASLLSVFIMVIFYLTLSDKISRLRYEPGMPLVVSNATGLGNDLRVENRLSTFFTFDPVKFVKIPYTSAIDPSRGRDNFWHFLLKTSLLGEFSESSPLLKILASTLSLFLLLLFPFFFFGLALSIKQFKTNLPIIVSLFLLIASMVVFRINYPFSCSNDFRYIYPAVLPFCILVGKGRDYLSRNRWGNFLCVCVLTIFVLLATVYQILNIFKY